MVIIYLVRQKMSEKADEKGLENVANIKATVNAIVQYSRDYAVAHESVVKSLNALFRYIEKQLEGISGIEVYSDVFYASYARAYQIGVKDGKVIVRVDDRDTSVNAISDDALNELAMYLGWVLSTIKERLEKQSRNELQLSDKLIRLLDEMGVSADAKQ